MSGAFSTAFGEAFPVGEPAPLPPLAMQREVDVEGMLSRFLRAQGAVTTVVGQRVYTDLPHERQYPLVLVQRTGGTSVSGFTLASPEVTISVYGGTHKQAQDLTALVLAYAITLVGPQPEGYVSGVVVGATQFDPDDTSPDQQGHARPRYVSTATVYTHP